MSGLVSPSGAPLSARKVRAGVQGHQAALRTLTQALANFLQLGFFGRMGWLFFGARVFGKRPPRMPSLQDVTDEARRRQALRDERPGLVS